MGAESPLDRLLRRFSWGEKFNGTRCMVFTGALTDGYGRIRANGSRPYAHRFLYEQWVGTVPEGLQIDHLCRNRACMNPMHVEVVTCKVNIQRGNTGKTKRQPKTHCLRGHEFTPENTYIYRGGRYCRACARARDLRRTKRPLLEKAQLEQVELGPSPCGSVDPPTSPK